MRLKTGLTMYGFVMLILGVTVSISAQGQDREQYVISAKAGGVNSLSGDVLLKRRGQAEWRSVTDQDNVDSGDVVRTGANGRLEMLLNPGSYFRVAENGEFELTDASLDMLQVKLINGSAIVEVAGADEARTQIGVMTPQTTVVIDRKGLYRINLEANGTTEVIVRKGRATIRGNSLVATEVKDKKKVVVGGGASVITKFDAKEKDGFDLWSEQRAEALVAANRRLSDKVIARSYANYSSGLNWRRGYRLSGLWIYDPFFSGRTFLPFFTGWSSPYGHSYSHGFGFHWHSRSYSPFYTPGGFGRGGGRVDSVFRHNNRHRSDHFSNRPHSGRVHHQSTIHRSSPHHRRGH